MGAQKKGGATPKQKGKGQVKSPAPPKAFEMEDFDDDDEFDVSDSGSDDGGVKTPANKKTPNKGATPNQKNSMKKKDMHVSFQLQGKNTPNQQKTPKGDKATPKGNKVMQGTPKGTPKAPAHKGTPMPGKKTPAGKQEKSLQEFSGMNNVFGGKIEKVSPPLKGKIHPAGKGFLKGKLANAGKRKAEDDSEEDDDDEDDDSDMDEGEDDFDDEDDLDDDDLDEEDDDDLDEEDDDDLDEEDDDELGDLNSDEEDLLRARILQIQTKKGKLAKKEIAALKADAKKAQKAAKSAAQTPKSKQNSQPTKPVQKTPKMPNSKADRAAAAVPVSPKTSNTQTAIKEEKQSPLKKSGAKTANPVDVSLEEKRRRERDARNLFIRGVPIDVTIQELQSLSPDILGVNKPKSQYHHKKPDQQTKTYFAFLEFASEAKAEENYNLLQTKKLRGAPLFVDFVGVKSKKFKEREQGSVVEYNKKKLFVSGLSIDTTIAEVAPLFPKSYSITLNNAPEFRNATMLYHNEEDAAAEFKANENATLRGRKLIVLHSTDMKNTKKRKSGKRNRNKKSKQPAKKARLDSQVLPKMEKEESEDDDDDDDEDDEDDEGEEVEE